MESKAIILKKQLFRVSIRVNDTFEASTRTRKRLFIHLKAIRVDVVEVLHSTGDVVPIVERVDEIKAKISNITLTTTKISQFLRKPKKVLADNNWHHRRKSFMPDTFCAILCHFMPFLCHLFSLAHHKKRLK